MTRNGAAATPTSLANRPTALKVLQKGAMRASHTLSIRFLRADGRFAATHGVSDFRNLQLRLDPGRSVSFNAKENPHLDYGYAVTSHSSQGQTADRVLIHIDTERVGEKLVNRRLAYVAVSRGRYDAKLHTNSQRLPKELGDIAWVIDGKDHKPTEMEEIWSLLVVPFAESHFMKTPLIMLVEGDYSDFDHRYKSDSDAELMSHRKWLETTYSIPARSRANPVTDPKLLLTEQLEFTDSKRHVGLQLADMLANIVRRALNNMLLQTGWEDLGKVLVEKKWKDNSWFQRIGNSRGHVLPSNHVVRVAEILKSKAKPMQHQK